MPTSSELTGNLPDTAIAVVGSACHLPGAMDVARYWQNLRNGVESIRLFSDEELIEAGIPAAQLGVPGYVKASPVLDRVAGFDPAFWGISPKDAAIMDPQHRHFLECAYEALEDAGHDPQRFDGTVGVFGGCGANSYLMFNLLTNPQLVDQVGMFLLRHTNNDKDFLTTFTSYQLGLDGPSVGVQTACSTSLVAIHVAAQSLLNGECDMALAGGSTVELPHLSGYRYQEGEILSPDGHCRPFDAASAGTVFGSGAGMVVLRRLRDALEDGDDIRAVIRGSAINNDGDRKAGYLAPSVDGQAHAVAEALAIAEVDADSISYVECHGTGTPVGDPIEVAALSQAFRETTEGVGFCSLGSVKSNIGHTDTAAGVASFLKVVEALRHAELPASLHFERPNPLLELDASPFRVQAQLEAWPQGATPRRAGVSSTGVGGTNAHVIVEEAPPYASEPPARALQVLPLAAKSEQALHAMAERLADHLERFPEHPLADIAFTLQEGRRAFAHRRVVVAANTADAITALRDIRASGSSLPSVAAETPRRIAFLLPGGGAQYPTMARDLYREEAVFRQSLDRGLGWLLDQHQLDLRPLLLDDATPESEAALQRPSLQLPAIFLIEMALAALWESWGITPDALLGHSLGENTAACLAGVFSYEDALGLVVLRGQLFERLPEGGMLSVAMAAEALEPLLDEALVIGVRNTPLMNVVSGPPESLVTLQQELDRREIEWQRIPIDCAAHSPMLAPILEAFGKYLRGIRLTPPRIPILSNRTGKWLSEEEATDPQYWVDHLRHTVRFTDNLEVLLEDENLQLLEVGPGKALTSLARQHPAAKKSHGFLASLRHRDEKADDQVFAAKVYGNLWCQGVALDWSRLRGPERRRKVSLPTYPFERQDYWIEPGQTREAETVSQKPQRLEDWDAWFTHQTWGPTRTTPVQVSKQRWLIFQDRHGLCTELASRLRSDGHEVITVREGDTFYPFAETEYALSPEAGRQDYDALIQHLQAADKLPDRIVHGWALTGEKDARPGSSMFHHNEERGFFSLFFLAQALGELEQLPELRLDVLANHLFRVEEGDFLHPEKALLLGPTTVIPREYPHFATHIWDLDTLRPNADTLLQDLQAEAPSDSLALRDGTLHARHRQTLESPQSESIPTEPWLAQEGVVLITGGLGGLGLCLAEQLAKQAQARLVLLSRSAFPAEESWDSWLAEHAAEDPTSQRILRLRELQEAGADVMVAQGDVAHLEEMRALVADVKRRFGRVDGVLHAAGILEDGIIQMRTPEAAERVFTPKVHGTLVLQELLQEERLKFFLLCSSTSVALGPAGQVDYVAANAFLNAFAASKDDRAGTRVIALNWGIWSEVGMAEALARRLTQQGESIRAITLARHPVLQQHQDCGRELQAWQGRIDAKSCWLLDEHRLRDGRAVLPGTAYLDLALTAFRKWKGERAVVLEQMQFLEACEVDDDSPIDLRVTFAPQDAGYAVEVQSRTAESSEPWRVHAVGQARVETEPVPAPVDLDALRQNATTDMQQAQAGCDALPDPQQQHLDFGPRFRTLRSLGFDGQDAFASLELDAELLDDLAAHPLHPGLLDAASGCAVASISGFEPEAGLYVPIHYGSLKFFAPLTPAIHVQVRRRMDANVDSEIVRYDADLFDPDGQVLVQVRDLQLKRLAPSAFARRAPAQAITHPHTTTPGEAAFLDALEQGIDRERGQQALHRVLHSEVPAVLAISSMDLALLAAAQDDAMQHLDDLPEVRFERPQLSTSFAEPEDAVEEQLASWWQELLGVEQVGIDDDFFEVGGHSLVAVRLFARIKKKWQLEYPLSVLFEAPTIRGCAALIRAELPEDSAIGTPSEAKPARPKHRYLVPLNDVRGRTGTPFFLVAGMFGNVLNLRHLAAHLDDDQPMYAIQARGLHGDDRPHCRFEDMARDYLEEIRQLQPEGPYLLGGFSGGGITAFEMAQQLRSVGEEVGALVLLDTPVTQVPNANRVERMLIWWERLCRGGAGYLVDWPRKRLAWEFEKRRQRASAEERDLAPAEFRSELIQDGFIEALKKYEIRPIDCRLTLFRPPLDRTFELPGGRLADEYREIQDDLNHWSPFAAAGIDRFEVPGDHDSMVLEPHVRVLGNLVAEVLRTAQSSVQPSA